MSLSGDSIFNHVQVASLRMFLASVVLLPFAFRAIRKVRSIKIWLMLAVVGFSGNFFPAYLFTFAETGISSGLTGMLNSFTPIFAILIGFLVFKTRLNSLQIAGVLIGTIGIVALSLSGSGFEVGGSLVHIGAVVLATLCYAISLNTIKYELQGMSGVDITSLAFLTVFLPSAFMVMMSGVPIVVQVNPAALEGLFFIGVLSVVGTAFAVFIFNILIARSTVLFSSSVTYIIPVVAVLIGLSVGERINVYQVLSMLVVLFGVFVANVLPKIVRSKNSSAEVLE